VSSPTVLKRRLGAELCNLRLAAGLTGPDVASALGWSLSKLSRLESGEVGLQDADASPLLKLYGVEDAEEIKQIRRLARQSRQPGWWQSYGESVPSWFKTYVGLEQDASKIRNFQPELVPGLLQTEDYARAVVRAAHPSETGEQIDRRVDLRLERQSILTRPSPPAVWVIIGEAVLRRPIGSPSVMAAQLERLAALGEEPHVTVQLLPFDAGAHASMDSSFVLFEFSDALPGGIVYAEIATGAIYMERPDEIGTYSEIFERLMATSVRPERSCEWLREVAKEYRDEA
jgi:transcriptional regulator with XRE-family HTH domain